MEKGKPARKSVFLTLLLLAMGLIAPLDHDTFAKNRSVREKGAVHRAKKAHYKVSARPGRQRIAAKRASLRTEARRVSSDSKRSRRGKATRVAHLKPESSKRRDPFKKPFLAGDFEDVRSGGSFRFSHIEDGKYVTRFQSGVKTVYTINPILQHTLKDFFRKNRVPYGVFVAMDPRTGKILALVEHSAREPYAKDLALRATYPAASIFKLITAAAAIEGAQARPDTQIVRFGRYTSVQTTLGEALAKSDNQAFAEIALRHLNVNTLVNYAGRFQFNRTIPFDLPVQVSRIQAKDSQRELADLAAGFGEVGLSPLHAALIGSAISNEGVMMSPCLVDHVLGAAGKTLFSCTPKIFATAISPETASLLREMMGMTITHGTARRAFRSTFREPVLRDIEMGGKTGSLTGKSPPGKVSWFVGMAPLDHPEIVISALVINSGSRHWKIKSSEVAREGFRVYFRSRNPVQGGKRL
jgi:cell division protein FtsI/penicillin-binding protein 2